MYRGGGCGGVVAGIVLIVLGLMLTFISFLFAAPGGTYFIFTGLIGSGLVTIVRGLVTPSAPIVPGGKYRKRPGPARNPIRSYVAIPEQMPPGYCWQCGHKVKAGRVMCAGCGATQLRGARRHAGNAVRQSDGDHAASAPAGATGWESWPPPRNPGSAEQRRGPMYQPGAPSPWDKWDARERPPDPPARPEWT